MCLSIIDKYGRDILAAYKISKMTANNKLGRADRRRALHTGAILVQQRCMVVTPDTDWFSDPLDPPNTVKLHILEGLLLCPA